MADKRKALEVTKVGEIVHDVYDDGLRFVVLRGPASWCAYAGLPVDHPLSGMSYDDLAGVGAHGGLTFGSIGKGYLPEGFYWYGWDYAHAGDVTVFDHDLSLGRKGPTPGEHDWTVEEVIKDSWGTLYDLKKLMKLAEKIRNGK